MGTYTGKNTYRRVFLYFGAGVNCFSWFLFVLACRASSTGVLVFGVAAGFLLVRFLSLSLLSLSLLSLSFLSWGLGNGFACCSMQSFLTSLLSYSPASFFVGSKTRNVDSKQSYRELSTPTLK
jgi:hypothetical protein